MPSPVAGTEGPELREGRGVSPKENCTKQGLAPKGRRGPTRGCWAELRPLRGRPCLRVPRHRSPSLPSLHLPQQSQRAASPCLGDPTLAEA